MARHVKNTSCPLCGSVDNRGVWDDGSEWCFGCHTYTPPKSQEVLKKYFSPKGIDKSYYAVTLPPDALEYLPGHAERWLKKYDLTKEEIAKLSPLYSFDRDLLIFPVYANNELLMWQGRYFGDDPKHPKYLTKGAKDVIHIIKSDDNEGRVAVVEDIISAAKLSTVMDAAPLWGSHLSLKLATRLALSYKSLTIWLDYDKATNSVKYRQEFAPLFEETISIVTKLDPKEYSHDDIRKSLQ